MKRIWAVVLALAAMVVFVRCGAGPAEEEEARELVITGLPGGEISVTNEQLRNGFEITELDAVSIDSKGTKTDTHAKGVLLETILQKHGASRTDFERATATASDGYEIAIPAEVLHGRDILIAFETNGEANVPRLVVPGERAMYWVKFLSEISLEKAMRETPVSEEISLVDLPGCAPGETLPLSRLLDALDVDEAAHVTIKSVDGLVKTEKLELFAKQTLVFDGPDAPLYTGVDLPRGMQVKNVESIQIGGVLVKM